MNLACVWLHEMANDIVRCTPGTSSGLTQYPHFEGADLDEPGKLRLFLFQQKSKYRMRQV
jgi:hypothetical protein